MSTEAEQMATALKDAGLFGMDEKYVDQVRETTPEDAAELLDVLRERGWMSEREAAAYRRGQEEMRERAAREITADTAGATWESRQAYEVAAGIVRRLPVTEPKP